MVAFEKKFRSNWKFGFPFFDKYKFIFDHNSKTIGFFCPNGCSDLNGNVKQNNTDLRYIFIVLGIIIAAIFLFIIGIFIGKKCFEERKRKANELLDLYEYKNDNKNVKDSEKLNI